VDEVLQFKRNFYAKLVDRSGNSATEVLVDPASGVVWTEYGPAMMWNSRYGMARQAEAMTGEYGASMMGGSATGMMGNSDAGMMGGSGYGGMMDGAGSASGSRVSTVTLAQAHALAQRWLDANQRGVKVETGGDQFPGYYTLETLRDSNITGMISINAATGAVWPHWWHGPFVAKSG
jgi:hypothetical protein